MGTTNKTINNSPKQTPAEVQKDRQSQGDVRLLNYLRTHAPQIVASISFAASRAGESRDWAQMNEYLAIAQQISVLTGLGLIQENAAPAKAMAVRRGPVKNLFFVFLNLSLDNINMVMLWLRSRREEKKMNLEMIKIAVDLLEALKEGVTESLGEVEAANLLAAIKLIKLGTKETAELKRVAA